MSDTKSMVMVASLERHLEEERKVIYEALVGMSAIPVGLAYPPMPANYIQKLNQQCIADADYVFILLGSEYGALTEKGVGYIHQTYANAQALRKPVVSLIYNGADRKIQDHFDQKRLEGLVTLLKTGLVYNWKSKDELRDVTERSFEKVTETYPSIGWVKSDLQPLVPEVQVGNSDIIQKLKQQVNTLKKRLDRTRPATPIKEISLSKQSPWHVKFSCNAFREGRLKQFNGHHDVEMSQVFDWLAAALLSPVTESRVRSVLAGRMHDQVLMHVKNEWSGSHAVSDVKVDHIAFDELKRRLRALEAIDFDEHGRWMLTPSGEALALSKTATS